MSVVQLIKPVFGGGDIDGAFALGLDTRQAIQNVREDIRQHESFRDRVAKELDQAIGLRDIANLINEFVFVPYETKSRPHRTVADQPSIEEDELDRTFIEYQGKGVESTRFCDSQELTRAWCLLRDPRTDELFPYDALRVHANTMKGRRIIIHHTWKRTHLYAYYRPETYELETIVMFSHSDSDEETTDDQTHWRSKHEQKRCQLLLAFQPGTGRLIKLNWADCATSPFESLAKEAARAVEQGKYSWNKMQQMIQWHIHKRETNVPRDVPFGHSGSYTGALSDTWYLAGLLLSDYHREDLQALVGDTMRLLEHVKPDWNAQFDLSANCLSSEMQSHSVFNWNISERGQEMQYGYTEGNHCSATTSITQDRDLIRLERTQRSDRYLGDGTAHLWRMVEFFRVAHGDSVNHLPCIVGHTSTWLYDQLALISPTHIRLSALSEQTLPCTVRSGVTATRKQSRLQVFDAELGLVFDGRMQSPEAYGRRDWSYVEYLHVSLEEHICRQERYLLPFGGNMREMVDDFRDDCTASPVPFDPHLSAGEEVDFDYEDVSTYPFVTFLDETDRDYFSSVENFCPDRYHYFETDTHWGKSLHPERVRLRTWETAAWRFVQCCDALRRAETTLNCLVVIRPVEKEQDDEQEEKTQLPLLQVRMTWMVQSKRDGTYRQACLDILHPGKPDVTQYTLQFRLGADTEPCIVWPPTPFIENVRMFDHMDLLHYLHMFGKLVHGPREISVPMQTSILNAAQEHLTYILLGVDWACAWSASELLKQQYERLNRYDAENLRPLMDTHPVWNTCFEKLRARPGRDMATGEDAGREEDGDVSEYEHDLEAPFLHEEDGECYIPARRQFLDNSSYRLIPDVYALQSKDPRVWCMVTEEVDGRTTWKQNYTFYYEHELAYDSVTMPPTSQFGNSDSRNNGQYRQVNENGAGQQGRGAGLNSLNHFNLKQGKRMLEASIDGNGSLRVKLGDRQRKWMMRPILYKAGAYVLRDAQNRIISKRYPCRIKIELSQDALVASDGRMDKLRASAGTTVEIHKVHLNLKEGTFSLTEDLTLTQCSICLEGIANMVGLLRPGYPYACTHRACMDCMMQLSVDPDNFRCPTCRAPFRGCKQVPVIDANEGVRNHRLQEAYSVYFDRNFAYQVNVPMRIPDFDRRMDVACAFGIHGFLNHDDKGMMPYWGLLAAADNIDPPALIDDGAAAAMPPPGGAPIVALAGGINEYVDLVGPEAQAEMMGEEALVDFPDEAPDLIEEREEGALYEEQKEGGARHPQQHVIQVIEDLQDEADDIEPGAAAVHDFEAFAAQHGQGADEKN